METFDYQLMKTVRIKRGLTQKDMADILQTNRTYISRWEAGKGIPDKEQILKLESALGVSLCKEDSKSEIIKDVKDYLLYPGLLILCAYISSLFNYSAYSIVLSIGAIVFVWKKKMSRVWLIFTIGIFLFIFLSYLDIQYHCFSTGHVYYLEP